MFLRAYSAFLSKFLSAFGVNPRLENRNSPLAIFNRQSSIGRSPVPGPHPLAPVPSACCLLLSACCLCFSWPLALSPQPPPSDPQAVAVLTQAINAAGGAARLGAIQDFTAPGSITYFWAGAQVRGGATVRGRGWDQFRLDANIPDGTRSHAVSHGVGALNDTSGRVNPIPYHNTINMGILTFPYLGILVRLSDRLTIISYVGLVSSGGRQLHQVRVQRHFPPPADPRETLANLCLTDYFVDSTSYLVIKTIDMTHPVRTLTESYAHEIDFENYATVNGVSVPMLVREKIAGQTIWELHLTGISFNVGLTDTDFVL